MKVLMFKPQFAEAVHEGTKKQTVRPERKNPIKLNQELSLRQWTGLPYRSKQIILREAICTETAKINITAEREILLDGKELEPLDVWLLAVADGFYSEVGLFEFFEKTHGLPFTGTLIKWN